MLEALEATIDPDGTVHLHEPVRFSAARRALVIVLDDGASKAESALLSEQALAADWDRPEEEEAWAHLQRRTDSASRPLDSVPHEPSSTPIRDKRPGASVLE